MDRITVTTQEVRRNRSADVPAADIAGADYSAADVAGVDTRTDQENHMDETSALVEPRRFADG